MIQSGGFFGRLIGLLLKTRKPLIKDVNKTVNSSKCFNSISINQSSTAADAGIHKTIIWFGNYPLGSALHTTVLVIWNDEMKIIIKIAKSVEDSGLLLQGISEVIQNKTKEQKEGFLSMLLSTLGQSLLGNILACKEMNRPGEEFIKAGYGFLLKKNFLCRLIFYLCLKDKSIIRMILDLMVFF